MEEIVELTIKELRTKNGYAIPRDIDIWKTHYENWPHISQRLCHSGLVEINPQTQSLILTKYGWVFTSFEKERNEIQERKKLETEQLQSVIDTNKSVKTTNTVIQKNANWQTKIFAGTLVISAITAMFATLSYIKGNELNKRIEQLEKQLQQKSVQPKKATNLNSDTIHS
ncbi:MAG: hypothetical protein M3Z26_15175 [Bacteroidota bacterium]|nr:hypothetical protein [Bacteroidota bacterium]